MPESSTDKKLIALLIIPLMANITFYMCPCWFRFSSGIHHALAKPKLNYQILCNFACERM